MSCTKYRLKGCMLVRDRKMPAVQKQVERHLCKSVWDRWKSELQIHLWFVRKKNKIKYTPLIGEWYTPLTYVKDALSSEAIYLCTAVVQKKTTKKIRKTQWGECRSEVKASNCSHRLDQLNQIWPCSRWRQFMCKWSKAILPKSRLVNRSDCRLKPRFQGPHIVQTLLIQKIMAFLIKY